MSDDTAPSSDWPGSIRLLMPPTNVNVFPEDWLPKQTAELSSEALVSLHVAVLRKIYKRIDGLKAERDKVIDDRDRARQERDNWSSQLDEMTIRAAELNNTRVSLEKQLATADNDLKVADRKINKLKADADDAGEYIRGLTNEKEVWLSQIKEMERQNTALVEQVVNLQEHADENARTAEAHRLDVNGLVAERTDLLGHITVLNRKLNAAAHDQPRTAEEQDGQLRQFVQDLAGKQPPLEQPKSVPLDREVHAMNEVLSSLTGLRQETQDAVINWVARRIERDRIANRNKED